VIFSAAHKLRVEVSSVMFSEFYHVPLYHHANYRLYLFCKFYLCV